MCNVNIGDNCIIGADSVVSKDIRSNSVAAGNPAKVICSIDELREKHNQSLLGHPAFEKPWYELRYATKEEIKRKSNGTFGYIKIRKSYG